MMSYLCFDSLVVGIGLVYWKFAFIMFLVGVLGLLYLFWFDGFVIY